MSLATHRVLARPTPRGSRRTPVSIGFLSTFPPTQCGLATFTAALLQELNVAGRRAGVVRVVDEASASPVGEVTAELLNGCPASAQRAAARLNEFDVVVLQHEY